MPIVLDYDGAGNVIGGHVVEELQQNPLLATPYHGPLSNPLYGHHAVLSTLNSHDYYPPNLPYASHQQPPFVHIYHAPMRSSSPDQTRGGAFLDSFTKYFAHDENTMLAFEALFTNYNRGGIDETDFYVGVYMLLSRTQSWDLLAGLLEVLPASWQAQDLTWLHRAAEAMYEEKLRGESSSSEVVGRPALDTFESAISDVVDHNVSDAVERISPGIIESTSPESNEHRSSFTSDAQLSVKRKKKPPANGFRTSYASTTKSSRPMYIDPRALMIHQPATDSMPDSDEGSDSVMADEQPVRKGLVKLKLTIKPRVEKSESASPRRASPKKRIKAKGSSLRETTTAGEHTEEPLPPAKAGKKARENSSGRTTLQKPPSRKGSTRYGDTVAAEIDHFGHFPTRRAVIARASRPYVHLACGKGFSHPMDLRDHHRNKARTSGEAGCPGKDGIPQGDDDKWDDHPSARIEYPDLNYTKVKDGYVILDQQSRDKIDNAVAAGLEYLAQRESRERDKLSDGEVDTEMEEDAEDETVEKTVDDEMGAEKAVFRAAKFGLRKRSTRSTKHEA